MGTVGRVVVEKELIGSHNVGKNERVEANLEVNVEVNSEAKLKVSLKVEVKFTE